MRLSRSSQGGSGGGLSGRLLRPGLSGRVAVIAVCAAFVAALAQWVATPLLAQGDIRFQRQMSASAGANLLAGIARSHAVAGRWGDIETLAEALAVSMPEGRSAVFDADWKLRADDGRDDTLPSPQALSRLAGSRSDVLIENERYYAIAPIEAGGVVYGYALYAFHPRAFLDIWLKIVVVNAVVLMLALLLIAPLILRAARGALKPVTDLETRIRMRDPADRSSLAASSDDPLLKPLLSAIEAVHVRSQAAMRRALTMAYADPVTRLPNRLRFMARLESALEGGARVVMAVVDLDGFRQVNVAYGPRVADLALAQLGERLRTLATAPDSPGVFTGRIGADQFGLLFEGAGRADVEPFLAQLASALGDPMNLDGQVVRLSASSGASACPDDARTAADLYKQAETALKEAKRRGGGRHAFFDAGLLQKAEALQRLREEVAQAVERGEFTAVYQPKVKLETGELTGAEALARWRRPDGLAVSPGVFIPIAEELGLIARLGRQVMREACLAAASWNREGRVCSVAVNVSSHQFDDPDFVDSVFSCLDESGLPPQLLELEITESAAVAEPERVARAMWPLRSRGVRLAIDDFGTGHSNFSAITRLPFDVFKIDQQFIRALSVDQNAPAIVEMILAMAEALGQDTVAEGVETRQQAEFLVRRGCTIGQGYYFSPPLPSEEFDAFVRTYRPRPADRFAA